MNKKILATAITALLATSAQAANIYDADGMTVDVSGGIEVFYGNTESDTGNNDNTIEIDDADLKFDLAYDLGNDVTAVGYFNIDGNADKTDMGNVYVGFSHATMGTLTVGKQDTILDDAGIFSDHEIGISSGVSSSTSSTQVIKYTFDTGMFYGGVAYLLNNSVATETDNSVIDGKIGVIVEDFDLTLYAGQETDYLDSDSGVVMDRTNVLFEVKYSLADLDLGAFIGQASLDAGVADVDVTSYGLSVAYQIDKVGLAAGFSSNDADVAGVDSVETYVANVDYAFTSNVSVYAEVGGDSVDNSDTLYNLGMVVSF
tara:strand:+ start:11077 stop:12021 length:945 start_codon:yes stop_codon:yes gene_type:complete